MRRLPGACTHSTNAAPYLVLWVPETGTKKQARVSSGLDAFNVSIFVLIAFSFVPAAWISFIVREKETKCKHQQVSAAVSVCRRSRVPGTHPGR